jgi:hypothetical protein
MGKNADFPFYCCFNRNGGEAGENLFHANREGWENGMGDISYRNIIFQPFLSR